MADYTPLLEKALDGKSDAGAAARQAIYARARTALASQLKMLDPPLSADEIARETGSLEAAIATVEGRFREPDADTGEPSAGPERTRPPIGGPPDGPAIRAPRSRITPLAVVAVLGLVAAPVALLAWTWRNQPRPPAARPAPAVEETVADQAAPKLGERLSGGRAPAAAAPAMRPSIPSTPSPPVADPTAPARAPSPEASVPVAELAVAQRVILLEDEGDPSTRRSTAGRALWRLDTVPGGPGQPLETVLRCSVDLADAGVSLALTLRRNTDPALPASHLIELVFTPASPDRSVREIGLPGMRLDETARGVPLSGRSVPVKENLFLIGLSDQRLDVEKNRELLVNRSWLDVPIRFASGGQALILVEKGLSGTRLVNEAFRVWGAAP